MSRAIRGRVSAILGSEPVRAVIAHVTGRVTVIWTRLLAGNAGRPEERHRHYSCGFQQVLSVYRTEVIVS